MTVAVALAKGGEDAGMVGAGGQHPGAFAQQGQLIAPGAGHHDLDQPHQHPVRAIGQQQQMPGIIQVDGALPVRGLLQLRIQRHQPAEMVW